MSAHQPPPPQGANSTIKPSKKLRLNKKRVSYAIGAIVILIALIAGGAYAYTQYLFSKVRTISVTSERPQIAGQPINVLLIGDNSRIGLNPNETKYFGSAAQVGGGRSDVSMIAHFDPKTKSVSLLSIPRDLFMPIPGTTTLQRVDAALNVSPNLLVKTIEYDLGIPIQHYVELNFDSFQGVVNALGGVQMDFPMKVKDKNSGLNITTVGCQTLNGFQALGLVRSRYLEYFSSTGHWVEDPLGDLSRTRRDHIFLKVLADKVKAGGISNPIRDEAILSSVLKAGLTLDSKFTESELLSLVMTYRHANIGNALTGTLPIAYENGPGPSYAGFTYNNVNYGDVAFPQEPADSHLVAQSLGLTVPNTPASKINITVVNESGIAVQGTQTTQALKALGYNINSTINTTPPSNPAEGVIYYTPGNLPQAEVLRSSLSGEIIMGEVASTGYGTPLELIVGSEFGVAKPTISSTTTAPGTMAPASTTAEVSATHTPTSVPNVTAATQINVSQQPQPWDPRACTFHG